VGIVHVPEGRKLTPHLSVMKNLKLGNGAEKDTVGVKVDKEGF
jgi:ABC-type branched-subunit amino acid transport system ATPase component